MLRAICITQMCEKYPALLLSLFLTIPLSFFSLLFFWHVTVLVFKAEEVKGNTFSHLFPAAQGRIVVEGIGSWGKLRFLLLN